MICYTLKGPGCTLEIHDEKIYLKKNAWRRFFKKDTPEVIEIDNLSNFAVTIPRYVWWGQIAWQTFDGRGGTFRFSTNPLMVKKIEQYLQKRTIKNHHHMRGLPTPRKKKAA